MDWISAHWVEIAAVVGGVVTVASVIVKMTPSVADDAVLDRVIGVLNALALNPKRPV